MLSTARKSGVIVLTKLEILLNLTIIVLMKIDISLITFVSQFYKAYF